MRLVLLGPPGSGKDTQGAALADHFGVPLVSSGELLRSGAGSSKSEEVAARIERGELVPDELVLAVVGEAVREADEGGGYILDGFPRTVGQARHPDSPALDAVVHLAVPDDVARQRLEQRAAGGRADDADPDAVDRRLSRYHADTEPLLDFYREKGLLTTVDAAQPPEAVTRAILDELGDR